MTEFCSKCGKPTDETNPTPFLGGDDFGYEESLTCNCDPCPVCGYIHQGFCERLPERPKFTCSSCGGGTDPERVLCKQCEQQGYQSSGAIIPCKRCHRLRLGEMVGEYCKQCSLDVKEEKLDRIISKGDTVTAGLQREIPPPTAPNIVIEDKALTREEEQKTILRDNISILELQVKKLELEKKKKELEHFMGYHNDTDIK